MVTSFTSVASTSPAGPSPPPHVFDTVPKGRPEMPSVRIPTVLRKHTNGEARLTADGATVGEVFTNITTHHPGLEDSLFEGRGLRGFINVYVEDEDIRYLDGLDTTVDGDDEIAIMPAVAGGA